MFRDLSAAYSALTPAEKTQYREAGSVAQVIHKAGGKSFGEVSRSMCRLAAKNKFAAKALSNIEHGRVAEGDIRRALMMNLHTLKSTVDKTKVEARATRRLLRDRSQLAADALVAFQQGPGIRVRDYIATQFRSLAAEVPHLHAENDPSMDSILNFCPAFDRDLPRFLGLASERQYRDFFDNLKIDWDKRRRLYIHAEQAPLIDDTSHKDSWAKPTCLEAGVCICHRDGDAMWDLRCFLLRSVKKGFSIGRPRLLLDEGGIVLQLQGYAEVDMHQLGVDFDEPMEQHRIVNSFVHLSLMYWKPVRPSLRIFSDEHHTDHHGHTHLVALRKYATFMQFAADIYEDSVDVWTCTFHHLVDSDRPIVDLDVRLVEVGEFTRVDTQYFRARPADTPSHGEDSGGGWAEGLDEIVLQDVEDTNSADEVDNEEELFDEADVSVPEGSISDHAMSEVSMHDDNGESPVDGDGVVEDGGDDLSGVEVGSSSDSSSDDSSSDDSSSEKSVDAAGGDGGDVGHDPAPMPKAKPKAKAADMEVELPNGFLRYYKATQVVVAHCAYHGEKACRLTRLMRGHKSALRAGQGRPVGLMLAWLADQHNHDANHDHVHMALPSFDSRAAERAAAAAGGNAQLLALMAEERPTREDEDQEPEVVP